MPILFFLLFSFTNLRAGEEIKPYKLIQRNYSLDTSINPCDDFHHYVCGNVEKEFKLPSNRSQYGFAFSDAAESILNYKKNYFENIKDIKTNSKKETAIKNYYLACINKDAVSKDEQELAKSLLKEISSIKTKEEMLNLLKDKFLSKNTGLVRSTSIRNQDNSNYTDIVFLPTIISLPEKTFYTKEGLESEYVNLISNLFKIIGKEDHAEIAKFIFNFEKNIADNFPTPLEIRQILNQKSFIARQDIVQLKNLKLENYIKQLPKNVKIRSLGIKTLSQLDQKINDLSVEDLKNIYLYINLKDIFDFSQPEYSKARFNFAAKYLGAPAIRSDRNEECTKEIMANFPMELDFILQDRIFPNFPKEKVKKLVADIRGQIIKTLNENKWLSKQGKAGAIKKMKNAKLFLVSPENERQWNFRTEAEYSIDHPVENSLKIKNLILTKDYNEFGKVLPTDRWEYGPLTMNAYYDPSFNHFVMLNAILQAPFFDESQSYAQNMASIGSVIGHELGHGIDDNGRRYDENGKLRDWVTKSDIEGLKTRSAPLIAQFNNIGHNGQLTLGENIGDLVGLSNSFKAVFPNFKQGKYSNQQLQEFYVQFAKMWCEVQTDSFKELRLKTDPHSLGYARINEQVKNQIGFQKAYSCKAGDKLFQTEDKMVKIW